MEELTGQLYTELLLSGVYRRLDPSAIERSSMDAATRL
jgi:hypothetical protein